VAAVELRDKSPNWFKIAEYESTDKEEEPEANCGGG